MKIKSKFKIALAAVGVFFVGLGALTLVKPSAAPTSLRVASSSGSQVPSAANEPYARVALGDLKGYAATRTDGFVVTSGIIVGIKLPDELVLGDGNGNYVLVTFARAVTKSFAEIFSNLKVGDTVQITGRVFITQGALVISPKGTTIDAGGGDAPYLAAVSLTSISKIE